VKLATDIDKAHGTEEMKTKSDLNLCGLVPRSLLPKSYSQTSKNPSFPNAPIGNPGETLTGPPTLRQTAQGRGEQGRTTIKTFGSDNFGMDFREWFLMPLQLAARWFVFLGNLRFYLRAAAIAKKSSRLSVWAMIACLASAPAIAQSQPFSMEAKMFNVQTPDGVKISAQEWGNLDGPEILFIHGFSQSHLSWSRQFGSELAKSFRLIAYDIRGHGASDKPLDAAYYQDHKRWADELKAVMETARLKKPFLAGWSYGGRIIMEYLMEYGDKNIAGINFVSAFTKVAPEILGPATPAVRKMTSENLAENIENTLSFLKLSTVKALPPDELSRLVAYNMVVPAKVRQYLIGRPAPYEEALRKIKVPVLITHGVEDQVALVSIARYTASVIPHAQSSLYEGAGHMPFWEDAPRFNRELADFVTRSKER
jgi:non-heme chloroperoxidase